MSEQTTLPGFLWEDLHIKQGKSDTAALRARFELQMLDTESFTNFELAELHGELARIAVVTGVAQAKKSPHWPAARDYLLLALEVIAAQYPLASTPEKAALRGEYWQPVYGEQQAQRIALMDVYELATVLQVLVPEIVTTEYRDMLYQISNALREETEANGTERQQLVFAIKHGSLDEATQAFESYQHSHWVGASDFDADQAITLGSLMLGRAVDARNWPTARSYTRLLVAAARSQKGMGTFTVRELLKNFSRQYKEKTLLKKLEQWSHEAAADAEFESAVTALLAQSYLGLHSKTVVAISS